MSARFLDCRPDKGVVAEQPEPRPNGIIQAGGWFLVLFQDWLKLRCPIPNRSVVYHARNCLNPVTPHGWPAAITVLASELQAPLLVE